MSLFGTQGISERSELMSGGGGQAISYCINASLTLSAIAHAVSCSFFGMLCVFVCVFLLC